MAKAHNWNVEHFFSVELEIQNGQVVDLATDATDPVLQPLASILQKLPEQYAELVIEFRSIGGYSPQTHWEPEEHSDDRELVRAYLLLNHQKFPIPSQLADQLFDHYLDEINKVDLPEPPEPDYEDDERYERRNRYDFPRQDLEPYEQIQRIAGTITEDPDINQPEASERCPQCGSDDTGPEMIDTGFLAGETSCQHCMACGHRWDMH